MAYVCPDFDGRLRLMKEDEFGGLAIIVVLFIVRAWSQVALDRAVQGCYDVGGDPQVTSSFWGSSWTVKCVKRG